MATKINSAYMYAFGTIAVVFHRFYAELTLKFLTKNIHISVRKSINYIAREFYLTPIRSIVVHQITLHLIHNAMDMEETVRNKLGTWTKKDTCRWVI